MSHENATNLNYVSPIPADNLFRDLSPESLSALDKIKQTKKFQKGELFFSAGEMPCCIYFLREGEAELSLKDNAGELHLIRPVRANEIIGLPEAITNLPYKTDAAASAPCLADYVRREDFIDFLQNEPEVCFRLLQKLGLSFKKGDDFFCCENFFSDCD